MVRPCLVRAEPERLPRARREVVLVKAAVGLLAGEMVRPCLDRAEPEIEALLQA